MSKRDKILVFICLNLIIVFLIGFFASMILIEKKQMNKMKEQGNTITLNEEEPIVSDEKIIPVKIKKLLNKKKYYTNYSVTIKVESEKYNLSKIFTQTNTSPYAYKIFTEELKEGDIIYAKMIVYKKGNKVTDREISKLVLKK